MPVRKVAGGYRWGNHGKVYPTRAQAERQGAAARAAGYHEPGTGTSTPRKKRRAR